MEDAAKHFVTKPPSERNDNDNLLDNAPLRRKVIIIENDEIGDEFWSPLIAQSLREYADLLDAGVLGHTGQDWFISSTGDKLTILAGSLIFQPTKPLCRQESDE